MIKVIFVKMKLDLYFVTYNCLFCLLGFNVGAAIFQLISDDEQEKDDNMNMK